MKTVTILCGIPGSGKSTRARTNYASAAKLSTDSYFTSYDGKYTFNPADLPKAHAACLRGFVSAIMGGTADILVDNTNTTIAEIAPYAALALAYGYDLEIVTLEADPRMAHARNVHGVPLAACEAMAFRLASREMPPWWRHTVVKVS